MIDAISTHGVWVGALLSGLAGLLCTLPRMHPARARLERAVAVIFAVCAVVFVPPLPPQGGSLDSAGGLEPLRGIMSALVCSLGAIGVVCLHVAGRIKTVGDDPGGRGGRRGETPLGAAAWMVLAGVVLVATRVTTVQGLIVAMMGASGVSAWIFGASELPGAFATALRSMRAGILTGVALMIVAGLSGAGPLEPILIDATGGVLTPLGRQRLCAGVLFAALVIGSPLLPGLPQWHGRVETHPAFVLVRWLAWIPAVRIVVEVGPSLAPVAWGEWAAPFAWGWAIVSVVLLIFRGPAHRRVLPETSDAGGWRALALACGVPTIFGAWTGTAGGLVGAFVVYGAVGMLLCGATCWEVGVNEGGAPTAGGRVIGAGIAGSVVAMVIGGLGSPLTWGVPRVARALMEGDSTQITRGTALAVVTLVVVVVASVAATRELLARMRGEDHGVSSAPKETLAMAAAVLVLGGVVAAPLGELASRLEGLVEAPLHHIQVRRCQAVTLRDAGRDHRLEEVSAPACEAAESSLRAVYGLTPAAVTAREGGAR